MYVLNWSSRRLQVVAARNNALNVCVTDRSALLKHFVGVVCHQSPACDVAGEMVGQSHRLPSWPNGRLRGVTACVA